MTFIKKNSLLLSLLILSSLIVWPIFLKGYFFHHDDLQVMRVFEMRKCFEDLQLPCRWVPDMGYGNGFPLFNFYGVLPYYIGGILSYFFGFVGAAKALFFIPLILSGVSMYFLAKEIFGDLGGILSGVLYQFAPYKALDIFVRGAVAESFGLAIIPLVFYFNLRLVKKGQIGDLIFFSLSLAAFLLSHNIMTMFFVPLILLFNLYWLIKTKKGFKKTVLALILGLGLAAFFLIPAFGEKNLVKSESLLTGGTDFRAHFATFGQIFFDREWGYGGSVFGPNDTISFQAGYPYWLLAVAALIFVLYLLILKKKFDILGVVLVGLTLLSVFMMHNKSAFIWERINILQYAQFPWRFLSITIFSTSLLGGYLLQKLPKKFQLSIWVFLIVGTVLLNWQYFKPKDFYPQVDDKVKLSDPLWEIQQKAGIGDFLPKTVWLEPQARAPELPEVRVGEVKNLTFNHSTNQFRTKVDVLSNATLEFPIFEFPDWTVFVNGQKTDHYFDKKWGRISLDLKPGSYQIEGKFYDTPLRTVSNLISLISLVALATIYFKRKWIFQK